MLHLLVDEVGSTTYFLRNRTSVTEVERKLKIERMWNNFTSPTANTLSRRSLRMRFGAGLRFLICKMFSKWITFVHDSKFLVWLRDFYPQISIARFSQIFILNRLSFFQKLWVYFISLPCTFEVPINWESITDQLQAQILFKRPAIIRFKPSSLTSSWLVWKKVNQFGSWISAEQACQVCSFFLQIWEIGFWN